MAGMVFLCTMAAFGLLSAVWALLGWLLPAGKGFAFVCWGEPEEGIVMRVKWLQGLGLLHSPLLVILDTVPDYSIYNSSIEYCSPDQLLSRLEQERRESDGTGNGDPSGNHQRCGLPEL